MKRRMFLSVVLGLLAITPVFGDTLWNTSQCSPGHSLMAQAKAVHNGLLWDSGPVNGGGSGPTAQATAFLFAPDGGVVSDLLSTASTAPGTADPKISLKHSFSSTFYTSRPNDKSQHLEQSDTSYNLKTANWSPSTPKLFELKMTFSKSGEEPKQIGFTSFSEGTSDGSGGNLGLWTVAWNGSQFHFTVNRRTTNGTWISEEHFKTWNQLPFTVSSYQLLPPNTGAKIRIWSMTHPSPATEYLNSHNGSTNDGSVTTSVELISP